jgi:signal transduction histidine kinase
MLEVSDNGSGFDNKLVSSDVASVKGMGMRTMEYRANLIGGRVQFLRGVKGGTVMNCEILKGGQI